MAVSISRQIAFEVLRRVEAEGAYASDLLHGELGANVKTADAALATELTMGVLRWRRLLDFLLERHLKKPVERLDLPVTLALRMGAYQLRFLKKIPPRAAVHESVEIVKRARKASAAALVNAVLRRIADEASSPAERLLPLEIDPAERLGILHSHPAWMVERWLARLGEAQTIALLEANNQTPRLSCALNDADRRDEIVAELEKAGLKVESGVLLKTALFASGGSVARTQAFRGGRISIQDEASQAVPLLLGVCEGDRVLDLCAAPGGKTPTLVRAAGSTGVVIAADRHFHRVRAMQAQFKRLGLPSVHLVVLDAAQPLPFRNQFDRILVDAPCSGTGTLARHPEIRWRLRAEQLADFHQLQRGLLQTAIAQLAPGGRIVYSTCSFEPEENEEVVAEVLESAAGIRRAPASELAQALQPHLAPAVNVESLFANDGYFRTSPPIQHTDGFFAAILQGI
ncbi:MAG TPA: 16S rRNA (cytosine(967)-C(5))-methyltransferase RsmB [Candidatus Acidoferrales bacterium]|nr:16S rRNA (cytosine(967)-C(5))-methyltransferase RsmB [Candidatus Acidoferrales bacterium]